ncbi:MAG TPA: amidohydrolase family protein [Gemmatimonadaceae bacterium]|nr:amidohydrolase family protein [Gemmatimonadaceae bacterium]
MPKVALEKFDDATPPQRTFADRAVELLESIVNNAEFPKLIRQAQYSNTYRAVSTTVLAVTTKDQIAEIVRDGLEFPPTPGGQPTIELNVGFDDTLPAKQLAEVTRFTKLIRANPDHFTKWHAENNALNLAALLMHEWMHVAGFFHLPGAGTSDVAYVLGKIVVSLGRTLGPSPLVPLGQQFDLGFGFLEAIESWDCPAIDPTEFEFVDEPVPLGTRLERPKYAALAATAAALEMPAAAPPAAEVAAIDVHAHTFNASDLSISGFLADVILDSDEKLPLRLVDSLVRLLAAVIGRAPGAEEEIRRLDELAAAARGRLLTSVRAAAEAERAARDAELEALVTREVERLRLSPREDDRELLLRLAAESGGVALAASADAALVPSIVRGIFVAPGTIGRYVRWVGRLRGYRHELIEELVRTYGSGPGSVALFTPALVDFARWLSDEPITPLDVQVLLGDRLSRAFPGRLHFLAAFDPWREADHEGTPSGSLHWARRAVEDHGFVGVKLYPPMGFSAAGNEAHDFSQVTTEDGPRFGRRLDAALERLFVWAEAEEVPLLAHCNESQGAKHGFARRAAPEYWRRALEKHPTLRLNLGHFGGQANLARPGGWPEQIIGLMNDFEHVYADVGMFRLDERAAREEWLTRLAAAADREPVLKERLLYGSDWVMLAKEKGAADFYAQLAAGLGDRFAPDETRAILGGNARRYLGLDGRAGRRLRAYYEMHGLPRPRWLPAT